MGGKSGMSFPKIKAPRITIGKDLGAKNIGKVASNVVKATGKAGEDIGRGVGKGATAAYQTAGKYGSALTKTLGKGVEGIVANSADLGENLVQGDFKGMGSEALQLLQSGKDIAKGLTKAQAGLATGALGTIGSSFSDKNITGAAKNIEREQNKGVDKYGDAAIDVGISAIPGVGQGYALAKMAAGGLSKDGLSSLTSMKGLQDMAIQAGASKLGLNPNMISGLKAGAAAASGDLKGAALQGLGSFGGIDPNMLKMASTGVSALTGDKKGLVSGLASQFGAGDSVANMVGAAAGGKKNDMLSALGGQLGLDPKMANMLGAVAGGDIKGAALSQLAGATGIPDDILKQVSTGKFDVGELAKNANLTASLGGMAQSYLPGSAGRIVESANAYKDDIQNQALDQMGRAGLPTDQVRGIQDMKKAAESTYKIAKGDTLGAIAKRMGVDVQALAAANGIKDINKIAAGMDLKMPAAVQQATNAVQDLSGKIGAGVVESGQVGQATFDAGKGNAFDPNVAFQEWSNSQTGYIGKEKKAFMQDLFNKRATGQVSNDDFVKQMESQGEKGFLDKAKDFLGGAKDAVTGAASAAGKFVDENKNIVATGIQGAAAIYGNKVGEESRVEREKLLEKQILETQGVDGLKKYQQSKERNEAYAQQDKFQQDVIAGGGVGAKEREMQQQGQDRAARAAAAGRLAGVEQQARLGGVGLGTAGLAGAFSGAQAQANVGADSERAAATSAAQNLKETYANRAAALESKATSDIALASSKDAMELDKLKQIAASRAGLGAIEEGRGTAEVNLVREGADLATGALYDRAVLGANATDKEREIAAQADVDQKKQAADAKIAADAKAKADLAAKANAAGNVSGTAPTQGNIQAASTTPTQTPTTGKVPTTQADKFNQAGQAPQPGQAPVSIPYQRPPEPPKPANPMDTMMNIVKNPGQALKNPGQVASTVQQVAKNPQAVAQEAANLAKKKLEDAAKQKAEQLKQQGIDAGKKAVAGLVPDSMKNIFNKF